MDEGDGLGSEGEDITWLRNILGKDTFRLLFKVHLWILFLFDPPPAEPLEDYSSVPASITERYKVGRTLGDGNFAVVRECVEKSTGRQFALKIISKEKCRGKVGRPPHSYITTESGLNYCSLTSVLFSSYDVDGVQFWISLISSLVSRWSHFLWN